MKKFEVWVTKWSEECGRQIKCIAGEFDCYPNAKLFAQAYADHYKATVDIIEYNMIGNNVIRPNV